MDTTISMDIKYIEEVKETETLIPSIISKRKRREHINLISHFKNNVNDF